jgi:steroid Delta-isomerase
VEPATTEDTVRAIFHAIEVGDIARATAGYAPDAVLHDPVGDPPYRGRAEIRAHSLANRGAVRVSEFRPDRIIVCGDRAAVDWHTVCYRPDGAEVAFHGVSFLTFDQRGLMARVEVFFDRSRLPDAPPGQPDTGPGQPAELAAD